MIVLISVVVFIPVDLNSVLQAADHFCRRNYLRTVVPLTVSNALHHGAVC